MTFFKEPAHPINEEFHKEEHSSMLFPLPSAKYYATLLLLWTIIQLNVLPYNMSIQKNTKYVMWK
jgi:hypothetical protein